MNRVRYKVETKLRSSGEKNNNDYYGYEQKKGVRIRAGKRKVLFIQICASLLLLTLIMVSKDSSFKFSKSFSETVDKILTQQTDFNELSKSNIVKSIGSAFEKGYEFATSSVFSFSSDDFIPPVDGEVTSKFKNRTHPVFNTTIEARGIEITAKNNSDVISIADGVVKIVATSTIQNQRVVVEYEDGLLGIYDGIISSVQKDDEVKQGQKIGQMYSENENAVLTFELWKNSKAINPEDYIDFDEKK